MVVEGFGGGVFMVGSSLASFHGVLVVVECSWWVHRGRLFAVLCSVAATIDRELN